MHNGMVSLQGDFPPLNVFGEDFEVAEKAKPTWKQMQEMNGRTTLDLPRALGVCWIRYQYPQLWHFP